MSLANNLKGKEIKEIRKFPFAALTSLLLLAFAMNVIASRL
jgi:hypothetical protein